MTRLAAGFAIGAFLLLTGNATLLVLTMGVGIGLALGTPRKGD